ncbi:DUF2956 domain-containing protein [Psychromonas sp. 14N.309.X.WAT.B.A12]|jgi:hypothetical protein|uniref:DUF2956 domain-containing protein n=1 Tax=unclassified Psychromonas TaxID=2614957 RepID=UPI0025AF9183|nr:DUF2956 domain-containing protein [Psychromonas sp. 14N.309.X.WAT.B.A12]MDN2664517.1 DUF2956 domain-containing protein [Psychromonas sp. 14N.309.X.WAT.B.A12]
MAKYTKPAISQETQDEALAMAKKVQKPGQTKEQTKLVAQGIQKGIAEYKKLAKSKQREANKAKKKKVPIEDAQSNTNIPHKPSTSILPWVLLAISWIGFVSYHFLNQ